MYLDESSPRYVSETQSCWSADLLDEATETEHRAILRRVWRRMAIIAAMAVIGLVGILVLIAIVE